LLKKGEFSDFIIYNDFSFYDTNKKGYSHIDFLIVSSKGLFVVESKYWNGVTYIYDDKCSSIFQGTQYKGFGVSAENKTRVFNVKNPADSTSKKDNGEKYNKPSEEELLFSEYKNPIDQACEYREALAEVLGVGVKVVKNLIVFSTNDKREVLYNNVRFNCERHGEFTYITTEENIESCLSKLREDAEGGIEVDAINKKIEKLNIRYKLKMDKKNCDEYPYSSMPFDENQANK